MNILVTQSKSQHRINTVAAKKEKQNRTENGSARIQNEFVQGNVVEVKDCCLVGFLIIFVQFKKELEADTKNGTCKHKLHTTSSSCEYDTGKNAIKLKKC